MIVGNKNTNMKILNFHLNSFKIINNLFNNLIENQNIFKYIIISLKKTHRILKKYSLMMMKQKTLHYKTNKLLIKMITNIIIFNRKVVL